MNHYETKFRVSSRRYTNPKTQMCSYVGRVRYYEDDAFLWSESTDIHRLTPIDAKLDAYRIAEERLSEAT